MKHFLFLMVFNSKKTICYWVFLSVCWFTYGKERLSALCDFINPALETTSTDSGLAGINQVYVINLDMRYERWLSTKKQLEGFGVIPQRVSAINGWKLNRGKLKQLYKSCVENGCFSYLTPGQLGCFLSHTSILHDALKKNYSCIWVLEDDILVINNVQELPNIVANLDEFDPEWDLLFTDINARGNHFEEIITFEEMLDKGFDYSLVYDSLFIPRENEEVKRIQCRLCTHSMIISARGIKKLLDYFQSIKIAFPIDVQMHCCPNKRFYVSKKEYVTNDIRQASDTNCRPRL